jgi:hypothetical protein
MTGCTILSARFANADHDAAVVETAEAGAVLASAADTPAWWPAVLAANPSAYEPPAVTLIDGVTFLGRVSDDEYRAILEASRENAQVARWLDILRLRGEVDVAGTTAQAAKAGLVALGLLGAARADAIFAPA